jgi:hypothetical protein
VTPPYGHHYATGLILLFVTFVLSSVSSLRGTARALMILTDLVPLPCPLTPCSWWTGRLWLLRLGYYKLTRPKEVADDWVWILDHSVQVGPEKCLLILGVRLSRLPPTSCCLGHADVEPIELRPVRHSTGDVVWEQLEEAAEKTGPPREILSDGGGDLQAGIRRFCDGHPQTCAIYDVTHKLAVLVKAFLSDTNAWSRFCQGAAHMKQCLQQTPLAALAPPAQKSKARFMNVDRLGRWASRVLDILAADPVVTEAVTLSAYTKLDKVSWLAAFRDDVKVWTGIFDMVDATQQVVRQEGFHAHCGQHVEAALEQLELPDSVIVFRDHVLEFIRMESAKAAPDERLVGSSEVIESVFGKMKHLEGAQSKQGFTGLILGAAAMVAPTDQQVVRAAMETVSTTEVQQWCRDHVGESVQAQRRRLFAASTSSGTKPG